MDILIRVSKITSSKKQGRVGMLPISNATWWKGVASGEFPQPIKLGKRTTCWRKSDIEALMNNY
jgi:predicted DNA-binding transcriptional regulator AlpA